MKKKLKALGLLLLAVLILIQFFHPVKNTSDSTVFANDISTIYYVPDSIQKILQASCYDCHSNNTEYPWYSNIQPVAWWLDNHIREGKKEINFSEFSTYMVRRKYKKMEEIIEQVKDDEMPLSSYTLVHRNAFLSKEEKISLANWATAVRDSIKAKYPADSLTKK